jgi:hypothetical protein
VFVNDVCVQGELGRSVKKQAQLQQIMHLLDEVMLVGPGGVCNVLRLTHTPVHHSQSGCLRDPVHRFQSWYFMLSIASAAADNGHEYMARRCLQRVEQELTTGPVVNEEFARRVPPRVLAALVWGKLGEVQQAERVLMGRGVFSIESLTERDVEEVMAEVRRGKDSIGRRDGLERELTRARMGLELVVGLGSIWDYFVRVDGRPEPPGQ